MPRRTTKPHRGAIYARVSRNDLLDGHGTNAQLRACRQLAAREGITVSAEFVDDDRSAWSTRRRRDGYAALLDALGDVDVVIAWSPDRLTRRTADLVELIDRLEETGTGVVTVQGGAVDLATAGGRMAAKLAGVIAEHESELKSERNKLRHLTLAEEGRPNGGGGRPYGFDVDKVTQRPDEADVIRDCAGRLCAGESLNGIVRDLNARDVPSVSGRPWRTATLRNLLLAPRVAGLRHHRGRLYPATWEPILSPAERAELQAVCSTATPSRGKPRRLLSGLAECGRCGSPLRSRVRHGTERVEYVCLSQPGVAGCGRLGVQAAPLDEWVVGAVLAVADAPPLAEAIDTGDRTPDAASKLVELDARRDEYAAMAARGEIAAADFTRFLAALDSQRVKLSEDATSDVLQRRASTATGELRERWPSMPTEARRAALDNLIERLVVLPGRRPVGERVEITWRA